MKVYIVTHEYVNDERVVDKVFLNKENARIYKDTYELLHSKLSAEIHEKEVVDSDESFEFQCFEVVELTYWINSKGTDYFYEVFETNTLQRQKINSMTFEKGIVDGYELTIIKIIEDEGTEQTLKENGEKYCELLMNNIIDRVKDGASVEVINKWLKDNFFQ